MWLLLFWTILQLEDPSSTISLDLVQSNAYSCWMRLECQVLTQSLNFENDKNKLVAEAGGICSHVP